MEQSIVDKVKSENIGRELALLKFVDAKDQDVEFIVTIPSLHEWKKFVSESQDEKRKQNAVENLVRCCVKSPSKQELETIFQKMPVVIYKIGDELVTLAGDVKKAEVSFL